MDANFYHNVCNFAFDSKFNLLNRPLICDRLKAIRLKSFYSVIARQQKPVSNVSIGKPLRYLRAFTLIELLVVLVIVAILTAVAYPSYMSCVRKSRRLDAQAVLQGLALAMERHYTERGSYLGAAIGGDSGKPAVYAQKSPIDGSQVYYELKIVSANFNQYVLKAVAVASQQEDGDLTLSSTGVRSWGDKPCWFGDC